VSRLVYPVDSLAFADQVAHTTSAVQTLTLSNTGTGPAGNITMTVRNGFIVSHNCPASLAIGASCAVSVSFQPVGVDDHIGTLTIVADGRSYEVALSGKGIMGLELTSSAVSATAGTTVALTWVSTSPTASCTAIGGNAGDGWAGPIASSGTLTVTASTAGEVAYGVHCSVNSNGTLFEAADQIAVNYTLPWVTISAASTNIQRGQSNTLTWTATNAETCAASSNGGSGQWSGARGTSGSATVAETTLGMITYTIVCTAGSQSAQSTVEVFVNAPSITPADGAGGGGGGSMEVGTLLALALVFVLRSRKKMRAKKCAC
jgi:hypothetical protein